MNATRLLARYPDRSKRTHVVRSVMVLIVLLAALVSCGSNDDETATQTTPVPTTAPVPTTTSTPTPAETPTTAPDPTTSPVPAPDPTATTAAAPTATAGPTATTAPTSTVEPTATVTTTPTATPTVAPTATPTATPIGSVITAAIGEEFVVSFDVEATSDFRWQLGELPSGSLLELVDEVYIAPADDADPNMARQRFTLRGLSDGQATLNFWLTHTNGSPLERAQFQVVIGSGAPSCAATYRVDVGERFEIVLQSNSTTGFRWEVRDIAVAGVVTLVSEEYVAPTSSTAGAAGWQRFVFEGVSDGETDIDFWYLRPFEQPPAPANLANFKAVVGTGIPGCSGIHKIAPGEDLEISLAANPSTGYRWELAEAPTPGVILLVKDEFVPQPPSSQVGAAGTQVFTFRGVAAGETPLKFWYVRSIDDPPVAIDRINFEIIVE